MYYRHWISESNSEHAYSYKWTIYENGIKIDNIITETDKLYFDMSEFNDYEVTVVVKNSTIGFSYYETYLVIENK